jgi:hypothetical protein
VAPWRRKFSRLNVLFICDGTAVKHRSLLNRSGICEGINRCICKLVMRNKDIYIYITNLVCCTYFHWLFNPECQHIFGKQTGYIFQSPKTIKTWTTKHYASLNQWFNRCGPMTSKVFKAQRFVCLLWYNRET